MVKLLDDRVIGYRMVGRHRRTAASALLAHRRTQQLEARRYADEPATLSEDLGLY